MNKPELKIRTLKQLIDDYEDAELYSVKNYENLLYNKYIHKVDLLKRVNYLTTLILNHNPAESKSKYLSFIKKAFKELYD